MQRVRIGLTGLALVFLLVLLATVIRSAGDAPAGNNVDRVLSEGSGNGQDARPTEPLAELGVAPGNADSNSVDGAGGTR